MYRDQAGGETVGAAPETHWDARALRRSSPDPHAEGAFIE